MTSQSQLRNKQMPIGLQIPWCPQPQGKHPLTSLLRQAFMCRGLLDMKNCQVVSAQGWGPGLSGAYCTLRISRRAEFLGSSRGHHGDNQCLAEAAALHSHVLTPRKSLTRGQSWTNNPGAPMDHPSPQGKAEERHILLPPMNSLFHIFCWESFHLKVHPTSLPDRKRTAVKSGSEDRNICRCFSILLHTRNWQSPASCKLFWPPTTVTDIPDNWWWHIHPFYSASDKWDLIPASERCHPCSWRASCEPSAGKVSSWDWPVCYAAWPTLGFWPEFLSWLCNAKTSI